jgi:hypothetical protein
MKTDSIIPKFNDNGVLPPHRGDPTVRADMSPFPATTLQLCERFGHTKVRRTMLHGFLEFRALLHELQLTKGFQWLDGCFLEDFEHTKGKSPDCIQVVNFCVKPRPFPHRDKSDAYARLLDMPAIERKFHVAYRTVDLEWTPERLVNHTRFWWGQMSHTEETDIWKGLVQVPLNTPEDDAAAIRYLNALEKK